MRVDFWSDIICPWCGLTEHRLAEAITQFAHGDEVEVVHRSFPLHPELPREGITQRELSRRYGMSPVDTERALLPIEKLAEREGLRPYHALDRTMGPTDLLHELLAYATEQGVHAQAWKSAFRAHFGEGADLWTADQVIAFAVSIGLDEAGVREAVESRHYRSSVESDQRAAQELGAAGTPFLVADNQSVMSGARDTAAIVAFLQDAWDARSPEEPALDGAMCLPNEGVCLPDGRATA